MGMPRPLSTTVTPPSARRVTSMREAYPAIASSTELSTTSQMRWWRPRGPVVPMYMPGRSRTASRPSRTVMSLAAYVSRVAVTTLLRGPGGTGKPACGGEIYTRVSLPERRLFPKLLAAPNRRFTAQRWHFRPTGRRSQLHIFDGIGAEFGHEQMPQFRHRVLEERNAAAVVCLDHQHAHLEIQRTSLLGPSRAGDPPPVSGDGHHHEWLAQPESA